MNYRNFDYIKRVILVLLVVLVMAMPVPAAADDPAAGWPIYRGDQALSGRAAGSLPERLRLLWTFQADDQIRSSPVVGQGMVFVGSYDGGVYALDLASGRPVWRFDTGSAVEAPPLLVEDTLFGPSRRITTSTGLRPSTAPAHSR
jgi:outer membrane protein assembly factor BamB